MFTRRHLLPAISAAAAMSALAGRAVAQDSTAPAAPVQRGDALDAYQVAAPSEQVNDFVVDLTPITTSWGNRYAIAPLLKAGRSTGSTTTHLNHLIAAQAASPRLAAAQPFPRPTYHAWAVPGQGVNDAVNAAPTDNGTGQFGPRAVAGLRSSQFGVAMLEFGPGPDDLFGNGDTEENLVAATVNFQTRRINRLYVSRTVALTNKAAAGFGGANTATAVLGLGAVDERGTAHLLADAHALLSPGRLLSKRLLRVESALRSAAVVNHLQNSGAADASSTTAIGGAAAGSIFSTPSMIPASLAGRPILIGADFASNFLAESAPGTLTATTVHLPTPAGSSRGSLSFIPDAFSPLASTGPHAGTAAVLSRTDANTTTRGISIFTLRTDGSVDGQLQLILPAAGATDPTDGFTPADSFPATTEHQLTGYQGQAPFRGGNGQVAMAVLPNGGDLLAAAVVAPTGDPGAVPPSPDNYIAVARVNAATGLTAWTIAAHTGDAAGSAGNASKAIRQDADGDGILDAAPIGRLALRFELPPGTPDGPSISAPAMDRAGNLYFLASVRLDLAPVPAYTTALLRANYDPGAGPAGGAGGYHLELIAAAGDVVRGANSSTDYRIEFLSVTDSDSADSGSLWSGNIVQGRVPLVSSGALPYSSPMSLGALVFRARILYDANADGQFIDPTTPAGAGSPDQPYNAMMVLMPRIRPGDANRDGAVNSSDISAFLTRWLADLTTGATTADWTSDGTVNSSDISAFLTDWLASLV